MIYDIAGLRVQIHNVYPLTTEFCRAYLSENQDAVADITVSVPQSEIEAERHKTPQYSLAQVENVCIYRHICWEMLAFGRMFLHAAVIDYAGAGYAFLGKSGAGKSTHTKLWLDYVKGAKIVNGDKPLLACTDGEVIAHGTPWMGKEFRGEKTQVPLKALCFIQQSKTNAIERLTGITAVNLLLGQLLMPTEANAIEQTLAFADMLIQKLPIYLLKCDISKTAVKTSFTALTGREYTEK